MHAAGAAPIPNAEQLMRRWFDEVWNQGRSDTIDQMFPETSVMWGVGRPDDSSKGPAVFKEFHRKMRSACPNVKIVLDHVVHQDDTAFARWTAIMTVTGEGLGVSPNGQRIEIRGMSACRAENGVITEGWNVWDQMGLARQLGLLQGPVTQLFA
jgi:predicted ester cyclase